MYLVWLPPGTPRARVRPLLLDQVAPELLARGALGLSMDLDDEDADVPAPVPLPEGAEPVQAIVSMWVDAYDFRAPLEAVLRSVADRIAGYQVVESLYGDYGRNPWSAPRNWPDGTRSPGLLTVALISPRPGMDPDDFYTFWHTRQSPMSEAVQPRCRYVRNAVFRPVTEGATPYAGIVEEAWPSAGHVVDPMLFYCADGDPATMNAHVTTMIEHVDAFMDLERAGQHDHERVAAADVRPTP